ncbi:MAG: respiratory nitrate reductase subunit gamma, partial [Bacteroidales bacterium]|nr:respiratory nitrate reductase subunit gamma [Bacteroidales bacterium]
MEHYFNNLLFTYFPHIAMAVFWFGLITRLVKTNKTIQAQSTQFFSDRKVRLGSNLFH